MRKLLISTALAAVALSAAPASAQYGNYGRNQGYNYNQGGNLDQRIANLGQRIDRSFQRRAITQNEARRLSNELIRIDRLLDRYRRNGLTQNEANDIRYRLQNLQQQIREDRQDGRRNDGRYNDGRYDRDYRDYRRDRDDDDD